MAYSLGIKNIISGIFKSQPTILGINARNLEMVYPNNPRKFFPLANDKLQTKTILENNNIACAETYAAIDKIGNIPEKWEQLSKLDNMALKPAQGSGGGGILLIRKNTNGDWEASGEVISTKQIHQHIANVIFGIYSFSTEDVLLAEELIVPHEFLISFYPKGVPDFRFIVYKGKLVMGMLRLPTAESDGKANLHQGGIGVGVDMKTGCLMQGFNGDEYFDCHPDTGVQITGKTIPFWKEMIQLSVDTDTCFPLNYLGIDIILDKNKGPIVMEINARPGLEIQNVNKQGLKQLLNAIDES